MQQIVLFQIELEVFCHRIKICQFKINSRSVAGPMGQMNRQTKRLMFQVLFFS